MVSPSEWIFRVQNHSTVSLSTGEKNFRNCSFEDTRKVKCFFVIIFSVVSLCPRLFRTQPASVTVQKCLSSASYFVGRNFQSEEAPKRSISCFHRWLSRNPCDLSSFHRFTGVHPFHQQPSKLRERNFLVLCWRSQQKKRLSPLKEVQKKGLFF